MAAVRSLQRMRAQDAVMPLYELMQNQLADPFVRRNAAEALVTLGLLRRPGSGVSRIFLWMAGLTLVIVSVGAAQTIGAAAVAVFLAGAAALAAYAIREFRKGQGTSDIYIGPNGEEIRLPTSRRRDELWAGGSDAWGWGGEGLGGGDGGGGGNGGGAA